ncbi:fasciclin domain-containing protein [Erythrobacter sp. HL-111]|uniref:fasciclin domain-containing protein n=1 Tax=Erythrobacter sp. HL-111 TaxID=1798193 RepID=UPI0006DB3AF3|nr:fasciclin domain-containing protein [Erythrobacter sp. HL-111]KPP91244.1 MAG: hypothetical protein HLUCCO15_08505 [Erythrobacteraceae bacterium HL-111]SDT07463.1 Uncaracterized surface protein containing fasciclin (FAS1) repeats [Erythrobacter sp. HL-111]
MRLTPNSFKAALLAGIASATGFAALTAAPAAADQHKVAQMETGTIVDIAKSTGMHDTLVEAVVAAELAETLSGPGPITVFAPVDDAFAALPEGTVEALLKPENKGALQAVLTYHAVPGKVTSADLMNLVRQGGGSATLETVQGGTLTAMAMDDEIVITDAAGRQTRVVKADVEASNGMVHATDGVFLPG